MKKIKLAGVLITCVILTACGKAKEPTIESRIEKKVNYINDNEITVYFNSNNSVDLTDISNLQDYDNVEDIELTNPYTFIGFNVEDEEPTDSDLSIIQGLLDQSDQKISVCFFGTKDFDYLEPLQPSGKEYDHQNTSTIAYCVGNFRSSDAEYQLSIDGYNFEDIVKDELQYKNAILSYIQKQYDQYEVI